MAVCWVLGLLLGAAGRCLWPCSFGTGLYAGSRFSVPLPFVWVLVSPVLAWGFPEWGLAFLAALTAACFSWTALGLRLLFGSAGWLLWPMLLFPELLLFPFLLFLWLRLLSGRRFEVNGNQGGYQQDKGRVAHIVENPVSLQGGKAEL